MKLWRSFLFALGLPAFIQSAFAQGQIIFANRSLPTADGSGTYDAPIESFISQPPIGDIINGRIGHAALLLVKADGTLRLVGTTTCRPDPYPDGMYFASTPTLTVEGVPPGETAVFLVRVFDPATTSPELVRDYSVQAHQSDFFRSLPLGGEANGRMYPIPKTTGLKAFDSGNVGPFGFDKNNQFLFAYLNPSTNWTKPHVLDEIPAGSTDLPMWKIYAPVDYIRGQDAYLGPAGTSLDLSSSAGPGRVSRTASVVPGSVSSVDFWLSGNPDPELSTESPIKTVRVTVEGASYTFS